MPARRAGLPAAVSALSPEPCAAAAPFERYVLPEIDVLYRVALSLTRNAADAEDVVQETLLRAYRSIDRFDGRHPRAWLLTILRNANINRARRRRPGLFTDPEEGARALESAAPGPSAEDEATAEVFDGAVASALAELPARFLQVVELVDLDGLSYQEAAEVLDVPIGTVMSRLHRARRRLREQLAEDGLVPRRQG
jgi:RNA polymerase sigma-70 factor (ECF subfamily)